MALPYLTNTEHPIDEFTGAKEREMLPSFDNNRTADTALTATLKNIAWNTTRLSIAVGVGTAVDRLSELAVGNKEDLSYFKRYLVYGVTLLAEIGAEKIFNKVVPVAIERASTAFCGFFNRRDVVEPSQMEPLLQMGNMSAP